MERAGCSCTGRTSASKPVGEPRAGIHHRCRLNTSGLASFGADAVALVSESAGTMTGKVASKGADAFEFTLAGAPADAKPIAFQRQKP